MKLLTPGRLATIKTLCCGVPYENTRCSKCWENYAHDLMLVDKFMTGQISLLAPDGYVRDRTGVLHSNETWKRWWDREREIPEPVFKKVKPISTIQKRCNTCREDKPLHEFYGGNGLFGRRSTCRYCSKIQKEKRKNG